MKQYDLIVVGTGSGGSVAATKCRQAGWKVAIIDELPYGGTCALRGCDPKKVLVGVAELIDWSRRMDGHGFSGDFSIDWATLLEFKRSFTIPVPEKREQGLKRRGIDTFFGKATFVSESMIQVGDVILEGKHILLATGAKPMQLGIKGEELLLHSDHFLEIEDLPKRIAFVGGGYISFEFAHIAARAGSEVHIFHKGESPLGQFDSDLVDLLVKASEEIGVNVHLDTKVAEIERSDNEFNIRTIRADQEERWTTDLIVHGAGREPALDMELERGSVGWGSEGVIVNEYLQSVTNPRVYAAGDVAATMSLPLTPMASRESHLVASNLLKGNHKKLEEIVTPTIVFTIPKLARVGMSELEAKASGRNVTINYKETTDWYTYKRMNEKVAAFKVIIDEEEDVILGAHVIGSGADELINVLAMAIRFKLSVKEVKRMVFAYPTSSSDIAYML
ncbi:dihydrolipoyl dehydrogenase family protein [Exiguobacterium alkaliphilum]|uniref:dihydrolipoyl dehydrogenase family protein n=1 Tax=Exiguobacterium alkaliphilum TaxID=1428684 RepID=UPI001BA470F9|nr:NAD(P)/FAD-dependent oxidoreductase [Exiguobacterium alkaliphilum]QUE87916.1 NAD(P)/FAD-dependent oxidoreductase [Exiguobacterium alkaliphilum]